MKRFLLAASPLLVLALLLVVGQGCGGRDGAIAGASADIQKLMKDRNLNEENVVAALKTYTPTGVHDEYYIFASGGHSGQVIVIGVPSMRILKYIAVFTPEPWQGYGYGDQTTALLRSGDRDGRELNWADTHHPALSETDGTYDGQYLFINDKANARVAVISLEDFTTKQIVFSELLRSDHGAAFVTPNTEYVIESGQYPVPLGGEFVPIEQYQEKYRSAVLFWKFDREKGRIDTAKSFAIELPPYMQDLADSGKLASDG
ncbi:MAG TPA: cytochrome C, partial [Thermoanaerobaculia bacterium]|nr:cytochrome C [Thermoanaerobaculia bacterium]